MFTGIVQTVASVLSLDPTPTGARLSLEAPGFAPDAHPGESIAVAGVCLTLVHPDPLTFDLVPETLARTTLGRVRTGARVNLERSLRPDSLLGGHLVQGHVDALARVEHVFTSGEHRLRLRPTPLAMPAIVPKGAVTLDGVSLTVAAADPARGTFDVALIPTTLDLTTLGDLRPGDDCNLETDILARTILHWLAHYATPGALAPRPSID